MNEPFDLVIIGGGTNGPAILLTALLSGFRRVALIERGNIGEGVDGRAANAAATGLIQPGLKYLQSDTSVVRTDALDCRLLKSVAGDLLQEQHFLLPAYREYGFPYSSNRVWDFYLRAYDKYSKIALHEPHLFLRASDVHSIEPFLRGNPTGAVRFDEWVTDPVQLTQALAGKAIELGGVIYSHREVFGFATRSIKGGREIISALIKDEQGRMSDVVGRYFINACGAWAPRITRMLDIDLKLRPTKGSSIIINRRLVESPVILFDEQRHYVTLLPRGETTVIGPSNIDVSGEVADNPDLAVPSSDEIGHLIEVANRYVAGGVSESEIIGTKCGLRPQLNHRGVSPYDITHRFGIFKHEYDGVMNMSSLVGGKLTSQLRMAKEITQIVARFLGYDFEWGIPELSLSEDNSEILIREKSYRRKSGLHFQGVARQERQITSSSRVQKIRAVANLARHGIRFPISRKRGRS